MVAVLILQLYFLYRTVRMVKSGQLLPHAGPAEAGPDYGQAQRSRARQAEGSAVGRSLVQLSLPSPLPPCNDLRDKAAAKAGDCWP